MNGSRFFAAGALAVAALIVPPATGYAGSPRAVTCPVLAAHRGFHYPYWRLPENSLGAVRAAAANGHAAWVETDVNMSKDNVPIIMHGAALSYLTALSGPPGNYTAAQLTAQRLYLVPGTATTPPSGLTWEHLPTMAQYLAQAKAVGVKVEAEESSLWTAAQFAAYIGVLKAAGGRSFVRVLGTNAAGLAKVRAAYPGIGTDLLVASFWPFTGSAADSVQLDAATGYLTGVQVAALHAAHVLVDYWSPDTPAAFATAMAGAPDMITTNNPTGFHQATGC
jgi:glycerophosphoryl diester phosphodiesterase